MERRHFMGIGSLFGAAIGAEFLQDTSLPAATGQVPDDRSNPSSDFWVNRVRESSAPLKFRGQAGHAETQGEKATQYQAPPPPQPPPPPQLINSSRNPVFAFWDRSHNKFVDATGEELTPTVADGDVDVTIKVARFRPSQDDATKFNNIKSGTLRIDVSQDAETTSTGQLAWSAIAGLLPGGNGKLPDLSQLHFDPGTAWGGRNKVTLTGGSGTWAWNFFLQKKDTIWEKILQRLMTHSLEVPCR